MAFLQTQQRYLQTRYYIWIETVDSNGTWRRNFYADSGTTKKQVRCIDPEFMLRSCPIVISQNKHFRSFPRAQRVANQTFSGLSYSAQSTRTGLICSIFFSHYIELYTLHCICRHQHISSLLKIVILFSHSSGFCHKSTLCDMSQIHLCLCSVLFFVQINKNQI